MSAQKIYDAEAIGRDIAKSLEGYRRIATSFDFSAFNAAAAQFKELGSQMAAVRASFAEMNETLKNISAPLARAFAEVARTAKQHRRVEEAGWLPHATTPFSDIPDDAGAHVVAGILAQHYRQEWPSVRAHFEERITSLDIDKDAREAFLEALASHEAGHYRAVTRMLFPEIERVYRVYLMDGTLKGLTGLRDLRETVPELPMSVFSGFENSIMSLVTKLLDHLYARVETVEELDAIRFDPVPNRHAAIHGLLVYKTLENSLNCLIMAEFLFALIAEIGRLKHAQQPV
jgi:hypothetical protein